MASSGSQFSNSYSSSPAKKSTIFGLFANTIGNTLEEKMVHALFDAHGNSLEKIEDFLSRNETVKDIIKLNYVTHLKWRLNKLCRHLASGEKNKAEDFLKDNLHLLPFLLKLKTTVKTPEGYTLHERTAAQIALSAKDVGREGCDLNLVSNAEPTNTSLKKLYLYNNGNDANSPFTYIVDGTEHTIVCGTAEGQLNAEHFDTLKAMYIAPLMNKDLNLSTEGLTDAQYKAYAALLKITEKIGHTEFVKEEGQVQMLQRYYNLLPEEGVFEKQRRDQFPAGWKAAADEEWQRDEQELKNVFKAIAQSNSDQDCAAAVQNFKNYLKQKLATPITTGFYGTDELLVKTREFVDEHVKKNINNFGGYWGRKSDVVFDHVIGPIEALLSSHAGMALAHGIYYQHEAGEKLTRDFTLRFVDMSSLDFLSGSGWIDDAGGPPCRRVVGARHVGAACCQNFFRAKTNIMQSLCCDQGIQSISIRRVENV